MRGSRWLAVVAVLAIGAVAYGGGGSDFHRGIVRAYLATSPTIALGYDLAVGDDLTVTGTSGLQDVTVGTTLDVTGAVSAGTTLDVTGLTTLDGGLTVSAGPISGVGDPYAVSGLLLTASTAGTVCSLSAGRCMDSTGVYPITAAALTVNLATTGAGGLDALCVAIAADTEYTVHVIGDSTGVASTVAYVSTGVAPTLPAGYDLRRRIAYCRTAVASAVLMRAVYQAPGWCNYLDPVTDCRLLAAGSEISWTEVACTSRVPASALATEWQLYGAATGAANTVAKISCLAALTNGQLGVSVSSATSTPNQVYGWLVFAGVQSIWYNAQDADIDLYADLRAFLDDLTQDR